MTTATDLSHLTSADRGIAHIRRIFVVCFQVGANVSRSTFYEHPVSLKTTEASRDVHRTLDASLALPSGRCFGCDLLIVDRSS